MAENEDPNEDEVESLDSEEEIGKNGKKKLLMVLVPLLLLIGGAGGAYFMGYLDGILGVAVEGDENTEEGDHAGAGKDAKTKDKKAENTVFLAIPTMLAQLNSEDEIPRHLRLTVQLELYNPTDKEIVEAAIPRVIDQFQTYLRELRVRDLKGSAGIYRLQMELLWRVNRAVEPVEVKDILFQEILIQ